MAKSCFDQYKNKVFTNMQACLKRSHWGNFQMYLEEHPNLESIIQSSIDRLEDVHHKIYYTRKENNMYHFVVVREEETEDGFVSVVREFT